MNRIPGNVTPPEPGAEGRSTHAQWVEQDTYQHRESTTSKADPQTEAPTAPRQGDPMSRVALARIME